MTAPQIFFGLGFPIKPIHEDLCMFRLRFGQLYMRYKEHRVSDKCKGVICPLGLWKRFLIKIDNLLLLNSMSSLSEIMVHNI